MYYDTFSGGSHMNVPWMSPSRGEGVTTEIICVREGRCSLPLTRGYATYPKILPPRSLPSKPARADFQDGAEFGSVS